MPRGAVKGDGRKSGRPKGSKDHPAIKRKQTLAEKKILARHANNSDLTPLDYMLFVMRKSKPKESRADTFLRMDAAKSAAPYLHRKMPVAVEVGSGSEVATPVRVVIEFKDARKPQE